MLRVALGVLVALWAAGAQAAEKLIIGPPAAWVRPVAYTPPGAPPETGPALRYLRFDQQINIGPDGQSIHVERVSQVRTAMGLAGSGTITVSWTPTTDTLTVHKVRIVRGDQVIDILARQSFSVIRREAELEQIVDGRLTATLQPEDLRIGDVLEVAYTLTHADPVLGGRADLGFDLRGYERAETVGVRATWPTARPVAWRIGNGLETPKVTWKGGVTELFLEMKDPKPVTFPKGAPARFRPSRELEFSEFGSWAEVAAIVAPLFAKASTLTADSPLKAEAAKIRALSPDPKVQAAAALKLVQDQVRYLGLVLTDGGYTPVDADKTWARRFGECKAKTALLIALLKELGVDAEPALVSAYGGEGLDKRLPRMGAFDHVIVRAVIGGKVYWLDGTRPGDGDLDSIAIPRHHWALPVRAEGSALVALVRPASDLPDSETIMTVDATAGIEAPARVRAEMVVRGDSGLFPAMLLNNLPVADRDKMLKAMWSAYPWVEVKTAAMARDVSGATRLTMDGTGKLAWLRTGTGLRWFLVPGAAFGYWSDNTYKRDPGPGDDAPFTVPFPSYTVSRFTMKLPQRGEGFAAPAEDVDKTVAGRAFLRKTRMEGGVVTIETSTRSLAEEFPASEAPAATTALKALASARVVIQAPRVYHPTDADIAAWLAQEPKTANEYIDRGVKLRSAGRRKEAMADYEKAVELAPDDSYPYANRGLARIDQGEYELGKADLERAAAKDSRNFVVQNGLGRLAMRDGRHADAIAAFTRSADLSPNNVYALGQRAEAYMALGEPDKALADFEEMVRLDPRMHQARFARSEIYARRRDNDRAIAEIDAAIAVAPENPDLHVYRGALLSRLGKREDAAKAFAASLALKPTLDAYLTRARYRHKADTGGKLADIDAAERLEPNHPTPAQMRARMQLEAGAPAQAVATLTRALKAHPADPELLMERARVHAKSGQAALAMKDIGVLRTKIAGDANALNSICWTQATLGLALEAALADCLASLKIRPKSPETIDSKGFVLLRLGRLKESVEAYDEALKLRPDNSASRYGRGLAKLKLGLKAEGEADLAEARKLEAEVDEAFADYGMAP